MGAAAGPRAEGRAVTDLLSAGTFAVDGPLPDGTVVLEASAGTGKTYTIAALATRYVAEGVAGLDRLMLVTFGRDATQELRERVRERLSGTERALAAVLAADGDLAAAPDPADPVVALLSRGELDEVARRRERLAAAAAGFDAATIATTHQFCQQMLAGLGVAGDNDPDAEFVEQIDDVVTEVVDDFYLRKYAAKGAGRPPFTRDEALALARAAVADPQAELEPSGAEPGSAAATRYAFATAVRAEVDARKRRLRLYSYDDMLTRLARALRDPSRGPAARERLRSRFSVVLVDEFQDTDPLQWEILERAFHHAPGTTLVLIGDPKQAIYAFRGADVHSYLQAARQADRQATLDTNRRSDSDLLVALEALLGQAALGHPDIVVLRVKAHHAQRRLAGAPSDAPVRLRVVDRDRIGAEDGGLGVAGDVEPDVTFVEDPSDLVEEVVYDLYVRRFHWTTTAYLTRAETLRIGRLAIDNPAARIVPAATDEQSLPAMRARLADAAREEFARRKRRMAVMTYDDLLTRLKEILEGRGGAVAVR
ncbi:MAG: UvrD-helicase domain-containing protein, partial [Actinomycetota bacterium]|nr:UvrD-helicase domain-containing protein [Actinomycetota bacterium]